MPQKGTSTLRIWDEWKPLLLDLKQRFTIAEGVTRLQEMLNIEAGSTEKPLDMRESKSESFASQLPSESLAVAELLGANPDLAPALRHALRKVAADVAYGPVLAQIADEDGPLLTELATTADLPIEALAVTEIVKAVEGDDHLRDRLQALLIKLGIECRAMKEGSILQRMYKSSGVTGHRRWADAG